MFKAHKKTPLSFVLFHLCLKDLAGVGIHENYAQRIAARGPKYGPAVKVGINFSKPWWKGLVLPVNGGHSYPIYHCALRELSVA